MAHFDTRTPAERARDYREANMTTAERIARVEYILRRAAKAGVSRPDLEEMLAELKRKRK